MFSIAACEPGSGLLCISAETRTRPPPGSSCPLPPLHSIGSSLRSPRLPRRAACTPRGLAAASASASPDRRAKTSVFARSGRASHTGDACSSGGFGALKDMAAGPSRSSSKIRPVAAGHLPSKVGTRCCCWPPSASNLLAVATLARTLSATLNTLKTQHKRASSSAPNNQKLAISLVAPSGQLRTSARRLVLAVGLGGAGYLAARRLELASRLALAAIRALAVTWRLASIYKCR